MATSTPVPFYGDTAPPTAAALENWFARRGYVRTGAGAS